MWVGGTRFLQHSRTVAGTPCLLFRTLHHSRVYCLFSMVLAVYVPLGTLAWQDVGVRYRSDDVVSAVEAESDRIQVFMVEATLLGKFYTVRYLSLAAQGL